MERKRVLVVEDDDFTRAMLVSALKLEGLEIAGDSATVRGGISVMEQLKPEIAIIDLHLGHGPTGLDLALSFRLRYPKLGIVLLTTFDDPRLLAPNLPEIPRGAVYMVKKDLVAISLLTKAIDQALRNVNGSEEESVIRVYRSSLNEVSDSQIETMRLVALGLSNREIALRKGISEKSVEQSISRLSNQLEIKKDEHRNIRVQIARMYYRLTGANSESAPR